MTNDYIRNNEKAIEEIFGLRRELNRKDNKLREREDKCLHNIADNLTDQSLIGKKVKVMAECSEWESYYSQKKKTIKEITGYYRGFVVTYFGIRLILKKVKKDGSESKLEYDPSLFDYKNIKSIEPEE